MNSVRAASPVQRAVRVMNAPAADGATRIFPYAAAVSLCKAVLRYQKVIIFPKGAVKPSLVRTLFLRRAALCCHKAIKLLARPEPPVTCRPAHLL